MQPDNSSFQQTPEKTELHSQYEEQKSPGPISRNYLFIFAIVIILAVLISALGVIFMMGNSSEGIEGKWMMTDANIINEDGSVNQEASDYYGVSVEGASWMEFSPDGTFQSGDSGGIDTTLGDTTWEVSGDTLTLTSDSESMVYKFGVSGNTLTLETEVYWGNTVQIVLHRV